MDAVLHEPVMAPLDRAPNPGASQAARAMGAFAALSLFLLVSPFISFLVFLFPVLSLACALLVYSYSKASYVSFALWIWFLTPFVHRLVDVHTGPEKVILLAPYLVTCVAGIYLVRNLHLLAVPEMFPFICALSAIFYGLCIGCLKFGPVVVGSISCEWLAPVFFAFLLYAYPDERAAILRNFQTTFGIAVLVTGSYGIYQFFAAPSWDMTWLQANIDELVSIGHPEPMQFRVFSTMNAPAVFGIAIMVGLLLLPSLNKALRLPAAAIGFVALLLTGSRSAWIGFAGGMLFLLGYANRRQRLHLSVQIVLFVLLLVGVLQIPILGTFIADRFNNVNDIRADTSFGDRVQGYKAAAGAILREPFGEGMGSTTVLHTGEVIGPHDSSFLESFYSLGWTGSLIYAGGIIFAIVRSFRSNENARGDFIRVGRAVIVAFVVQSPLNSVMLGQAGFFLWSVIALTLKELDVQRPAYEPQPVLQQPLTGFSLAE